MGISVVSMGLTPQHAAQQSPSSSARTAAFASSAASAAGMTAHSSISTPVARRGLPSLPKHARTLSMPSRFSAGITSESSVGFIAAPPLVSARIVGPQDTTPSRTKPLHTPHSSTSPRPVPISSRPIGAGCAAATTVSSSASASSGAPVSPRHAASAASASTPAGIRNEYRQPSRLDIAPATPHASRCPATMVMDSTKLARVRRSPRNHWAVRRTMGVQSMLWAAPLSIHSASCAP